MAQRAADDRRRRSVGRQDLLRDGMHTRRYRRFMDARTTKQKASAASDVPHAHVESSAKRDRLLASIALIAGIGIIIALPFALRAGAEFFLPVTAALVIAITLVPMLEWFERRGVPSRLAAAICVVFFLLLALFAVGSIVIPAIEWVA